MTHFAEHAFNPCLTPFTRLLPYTLSTTAAPLTSLLSNSITYTKNYHIKQVLNNVKLFQFLICDRPQLHTS